MEDEKAEIERPTETKNGGCQKQCSEGVACMRLAVGDVRPRWKAGSG